MATFGTKETRRRQKKSKQKKIKKHSTSCVEYHYPQTNKLTLISYKQLGEQRNRTWWRTPQHGTQKLKTH